MTEPTEPTPGAPAPAPAPTPQPPASTPAPNPPAEDIASLPEWAQKQIRDARAEAGKARTDAKTAAANEARQALAAEVARALGLAPEVPPDPAQLTAQIELARDQAWASGVELHVFRFAAQAGADPEALLDSRAFITSLDDLAEIDPASPEFKTQLQAKVQEAAAKYPAKTGGPAPTGGPRPDPSQGARGSQQSRPTHLGEAVKAHYASR